MINISYLKSLEFTSRLIPESARWLLMKGRTEEAKKVLSTTLRKSKVHISDKDLNELLFEKQETSASVGKKATLLDLVRHPRLRWISLLLLLNW